MIYAVVKSLARRVKKRFGSQAWEIIQNALWKVLSQHPLTRGGIPAVEQPKMGKVVQEHPLARGGIPAVEQP